MKTRYKTVITGLISIGSGASLFYPFFDMAIRSQIASPDYSFFMISELVKLFFFDVGFSFFHIPAYALIIIGSVIIWKFRK